MVSTVQMCILQDMGSYKSNQISSRRRHRRWYYRLQDHLDATMLGYLDTRARHKAFILNELHIVNVHGPVEDTRVLNMDQRITQFVQNMKYMDLRPAMPTYRCTACYCQFRTFHRHGDIWNLTCSKCREARALDDV